MKKILFATILSSLILASCTNVDTTKKNDEGITWKTAMSLPAQKGQTQNVGTAGMLYGVLDNDYIVVGGGANFPTPLIEGGKKVTCSDIYLLKDVNGNLELVSHTQFPHKIAYGSSITTKDGVYYIGGSPEDGKGDDIWFVSMKDGQLNLKKVGELPFTYANGKAFIKNDKIYLVAGKVDGKNSNKFCSYDLRTNEIKELPNFPGDARQQPVGALLNGEIYVFGGGSSVAYTDGYKYSFALEKWLPVADVIINGKGVSLLGGNTVKLNDNEMMVIGGFNKKIWDDANHYLSTLKGDELKHYRDVYFGTDPQDFHWNKEMLVYNAKQNSWKSLGDIPFNAPCGEALVKIGNNIISINGEIKPGVRTNKVFMGYMH